MGECLFFVKFLSCHRLVSIAILILFAITQPSTPEEIATLPDKSIVASDEYYILDLPGIPQVGQERALGAWWPQIIDVSSIVPPGMPPLILIASTDHADGDNPGGGIYIWRGHNPQGPWTFGGQFFVGTKQYRQMEAPTAHVLVDPKDGQSKLFVWAHYVPRPFEHDGPRAHRQISLALVSADAVAPLKPIPETALDAALPEYDLKDEPYNAHLGYLSVMPNIFDGLINPETRKPWSLIGTSMYGSRATKNRIFGRAVWGLESPRSAPKLITRHVNDRRFVRKAPTRLIDSGSITPQFADPNGKLWGLFLTGGSGGFEIRAASQDKWGLVTSGAETLFQAVSIRKEDYPAPFSSSAKIKSPQVLTVFKEANGRIWALANVVLSEKGLLDTNITVAVPLNGTRAPSFPQSRELILRDSFQTEIKFTNNAKGFSVSDGIGIESGEVIVKPQGSTWEFISWTTPSSLSSFGFVRISLEGFSEEFAADLANAGDLWVFAVPSNSKYPLASGGVFAGANVASTSNGRAQFASVGPDSVGHNPDTSPRLLIGRGVGEPNWRYDLGIIIWPSKQSAGVTHSADSLVETFKISDQYFEQPWKLGIAIRRGSPDAAHSTRIRTLRVTTTPPY